MPRPSRPWFRFYVEAVSDRKLRRLRPEHRWLFVACLAAARQSSEPGTLLVGEGSPMDCHDLADFAGMDVRTVRAGMAALDRAGLIVTSSRGDRGEIAYRSPAFVTRQFESDDVTARTRKHRATRASAPEGTFQTRSMERSQTVPGTHQRTETETETETAKHLPVVVPPLAAVSPTPGGEAVDLEHHPRPRHTPAATANLVANIQAVRTAAFTPDEPA